ncbi:MAG TPA: hypothetical protein VIU81_08510, partial [Gaiellaceae bacterium]
APAGQLVVTVSTSQAWPTGLLLTKLNRPISLTVPETALVQTAGSTGAYRSVADLSLAQKGQKVVVWTEPAPSSLKAQRGDDFVLSAALIQLG